MADWLLVFSARDSNPAETLPLERYAEVVAGVLGAPVTTDDGGDLTGNPRDMFTRIARITGQLPDGSVRLALAATQWSGTSADPKPVTPTLRVELAGENGAFAAKLALWERLRDVVAGLGYRDDTLIEKPFAIVDNAEAVGEAATGARLRTEIRQALVGQAPRYGVVYLVDTRVDDIEPVLAAYPKPETTYEITFQNCKLGTLPAGIARFTNVQSLTFDDTATDLGGLRGASLPVLSKLVLAHSGIQRVSRDHVAGLPALAELDCRYSQLAELDPDIISVCPQLKRVGIWSTPLTRDHARVAALRERWRGITFE